MRDCIGDSQIQSCGCAERRFAKVSGLVCDTLMNRTAGVKKKAFFKLPENELFHKKYKRGQKQKDHDISILLSELPAYV